MERSHQSRMAASHASPIEFGSEVVSVRVTVAERAHRDTDEHVDWLAKHASVAVANRFFEAVLQTIDEISESPDNGILWEPEDPFEIGTSQSFVARSQPFGIIWFITSASKTAFACSESCMVLATSAASVGQLIDS